LENVSGGEQVARYALIGIHPSQACVIWPGKFERHTTSGVETRALTEGCDPLTLLYEPNHTHGLDWAMQPGLERFLVFQGRQCKFRRIKGICPAARRGVLITH
jgi:hypothetical protein